MLQKTWRVPAVLVVATAACSTTTAGDAGIDATPAIDGGTCDGTMPGRMCEPVCYEATGPSQYTPFACDYFCDIPDAPNVITHCYTSEGQETIDCTFDPTMGMVIC